jgi:hypothetical protein
LSATSRIVSPVGFLKHLVDVHDRAIRRQDRDGLANGIGDGAKVCRLLAEFLLGALEVIDVGIDPTPADKVCLLIVDRRCGDPEPAIGSVETAKAFFRRACLFGMPDVLPPGFELWDIARMDNRFPLPSRQLFRRKPGVISKSFVDEIQRAIRQSGPSNRPNGVDEIAEFQGSRALSLTRTNKSESDELARDLR